MKEEKYAYFDFGYPLMLSLLLKGFGEGILNPRENTSFKWTEDLYGQSNGQIAWIRRRISEWVEMVSRESGVSVMSYQFKSRRYSSDRHKSWEVEFEFVISGAINFTVLHQAMAKDFSGFFKKFLARELLLRFPLPFDMHGFGTNSIPFCAGITDMFILKPKRERGSEFENANKILFGEEFRLWLEKILKEKYSAKLFGMKSTGALHWLCSFIFLKWQNDATCEVRNALRREIEKKLEEIGATYRLSGYGPGGQDSHEFAFYTVNYN